MPAIDPASCLDMPLSSFNIDWGFLYWDVVHPTTEAHRAMGEYMYNQLLSEYE